MDAIRYMQIDGAAQYIFIVCYYIRKVIMGTEKCIDNFK